MKLSEDTIFWYDSETTGFDENKHQMLSFAIVATDENYQVKGSLYELIKLNGQSEITEQAMSVNKIDLSSQEYIRKSINEDELISKVNSFIKQYKTDNSVSMAHNAAFDSKFYKATALRVKKENHLEIIKSLCSIKFFKKAISLGLLKTEEISDLKGKTYQSAKLEHICKALKLTHNAHNALGDTLALIEAYKIINFKMTNNDYFDIRKKDF